jgi:LPS O-antigen subunit length determinant protein (WzzB/FepE family)
MNATATAVVATTAATSPTAAAAASTAVARLTHPIAQLLQRWLQPLAERLHYSVWLTHKQLQDKAHSNRGVLRA